MMVFPFKFALEYNCNSTPEKILAAGDDAILEKIKKYTADMKAQVVAKDAKLKQVGYKQYLAEK